MTVNMYAIYDEKAETYNAPYPVSTDGVAVRAFEAACQDTGTDLYKFAGDYKLYCIGTYDDSTGVLSATIPPRYLVTNNPVKSHTEKELDKIEKEIENEVSDEV